jgi:hypothetical protein
MVNNHRGFIIHKTAKKKGKGHMITIFIKKIILSLPSKQVVNVADLRYLGVEKDFPAEQLSSYYLVKRK